MENFEDSKMTKFFLVWERCLALGWYQEAFLLGLLLISKRLIGKEDLQNMPNTVYLLGGIIIYQTLFKSVFSYLLTNVFYPPEHRSGWRK